MEPENPKSFLTSKQLPPLKNITEIRSAASTMPNIQNLVSPSTKTPKNTDTNFSGPNSCHKKNPYNIDNLKPLEFTPETRTSTIDPEIQEQEDQYIEVENLQIFLERTREQTKAKIAELQKTLGFIEGDIIRVEGLKKTLSPAPSSQVSPSVLGKRMIEETALIQYSQNLRNAKKKMLETNLPALQNVYNDIHIKHSGAQALQSFSDNFTKFTSYSALKAIKKMKTSTCDSSENFVTSIEFDANDFMFAMSCNKKIKIFEYNSVLHSDSEMQEPKQVLTTHSRLTSLSYNPYFHSKIASGEQSGIVNIWNTDNASNFMCWAEHQKRVWSVDFSPSNPTLLASGSDDGTVKVWCINQANSIATLKSKMNVCSVRFNPFITDQIVFGSSDHCLYYYDLRFAGSPLMVLKGHKKAVSNVRFLSKDELVTSSIDHTLKLWQIQKSDVDSMCVRTYTGHVNEKNFVGLSCAGDYLSCGSEDNSVVTYHKDFSSSVVSHKFGGDKDNGFVSALCWKRRKNAMVAANSNGEVKILQLE